MIDAHPETKFTILLFDAPSTLDDYLANIEENSQVKSQAEMKDPTETTETTKTSKNVEIVRIGKLRISNYLNYLWYQAQYYPAIKKIMKKSHLSKKIDTENISVNSSKTKNPTNTPKKPPVYLSPYFWHYYPSKTLPTVLFIHDFTLPIFNSYSAKSKIHNYLRKFQYWHAMNYSQHCKAIVTNIKHTRDEYISRYPNYPADKVFDIPLGIEMETSDVNREKILKKYFHQDVSNKGYYIYLGGEVTFSKNTEGILWGYYRLKQKVKNPPYLVIAGKEFLNLDRKDVRDLHKLIAKLDLKNDIVFTGFYKDNEKYVLLKNSVAFIHLSYYEGFGLALGEAMKSGAPIIANNSQAYKYVLGDTGLLVDGRNPWKVADAMELLYRDRALGKSLGEKAQVRSKKFTWDKTAEKIYQVLKGVYDEQK